MVETGLLEQEPEPDIRSFLRTSPSHHPRTAYDVDTETVKTDDSDAIQQPRLNPTSTSQPPINQIKEKDFVRLQRIEDVPVLDTLDASKPGLGDQNRLFPAFTRLRKPYLSDDPSSRPQRSQSTPAHSRVTFPATNTKPKDDTPSAFAQAEPLPPARLNDVGPPRPPKSIAELFAPDRKLGGDPGWAQSFVNTVKCELA